MKIYKLLSLGILLLLTVTINAQELNQKQEALFIYNILRHVDWPRDDGHGEFIIQVLGKGDIIKEIQAMASQKTVGDRKIIVKVYDDPKQLEHCHLLFLTKSHTCCLQQARQKLKNMSTLFVTEDKGAISLGSDINFIGTGDKIMFEMNENSMKENNLKMSKELKKLAVVK